jgi:hypothetical protein
MSIESTGTTISKIAIQILSIETLHTRDSDSLDFHYVPVWYIKEALLAAYNAGRNSLIPDFINALAQLQEYSDNEYVMGVDAKDFYHVGNKLESLNEKITLASIKDDLL